MVLLLRRTQMKFEIGDKAVVPNHGVGIVKEIESLDLGGDQYDMYVIKILDNGMIYKMDFSDATYTEFTE